MRRLRWVVIPTLLAVSQVEAQRSLEVSCSDCEIQFDLELQLLHESIGSIRTVALDAKDRYWVVNNRGMPAVFDRSGAFIGTVGRRGSGPMEVLRPENVWRLPGDSLAIVDGAGKLLVYDNDFNYVRTVSFPEGQLFSGVVLEWPRSVVVNAIIRTPEHAGFPLHVLDMSASPAQITRSFGSDGTLTSNESTNSLRRMLYPASAGGFWAAHRGEYAVSRWTADLVERPVIRRRPPWFAAQSSGLPGGPETPPSPSLAGVVEDSDGLLWTVSLVPSPDWKRAWDRIDPNQPSGEMSAGAIDWEFLYDTRVSVIDPNTGELLAERVLDTAMTAILPGARLAFALQTEVGEPVVRVINLRFSRGEASR